MLLGSMSGLFSSLRSVAKEEVGRPFRDRFQSYRQTFRVEPDLEEAKRIVRNIIKEGN